MRRRLKGSVSIICEERFSIRETCLTRANNAIQMLQLLIFRKGVPEQT